MSRQPLPPDFPGILQNPGFRVRGCRPDARSRQVQSSEGPPEADWPTQYPGMRSSWTKRKRPREALLFLFPFAVAGIAENAYATESEPTSATALIREWKSVEAICRGSNEASACEAQRRSGATGVVLQRIQFWSAVGKVLVTRVTFRASIGSAH